MRSAPLHNKRFGSPKAEEMRLKSLYRTYATRTRLNISAKDLAKLIGPDCAYHLYRNIGNK